MKPYLYAFSFIVLCVWQAQGIAFDDTQLGSIKRLGQLNGIALHCKALGETRKMKRALVSNLPKRRQLGELFDQETHKSYMNFIRGQAVCPGPATLAEKVDAAISDLQTAFKKQ